MATSTEFSAGGVVVRGDETIVIVPIRRAANGRAVLALPKGHVDPGETPAQAATREVREEAGLECAALTLRGTISWPGFGPRGEDWFGFVFVIDRWTGMPRDYCPEGTLVWVDVDRVLELPLWEGDRHFLPLVFGPARGTFHGVMPYAGGRLLSWSYSVV